MLHSFEVGDIIKHNHKSSAVPLAGSQLRALRSFIFDLDGVIWRGSTAIEGAVESVARLQAAGKQCYYCTNNSARTLQDFVERLRGLGIAVDEDHIMTSSSATALHLANEFNRPYSAYVLGGEGLVQSLQGAGARALVGPEATEAVTNENVFGFIREAGHTEPLGLTMDDALVDVVAVGIDRSFTYGRLRLAQFFIMQGARFIATNPDTTFPTEIGLVPGAGSIVAAVATASGVQPVVIGKPEPLMIELCLQKYGLDAATTAMIGDRLDTDIVSAHRAGVPALYVATGISPMDDAQSATGDEKPDALFVDLPALCDAVLGD